MPRCRNIFALFPPFPPAKTNASFAGAVPQSSWHARALSYVIFVSLPGAPFWPTGLIQPLERADLVSAREAALTFYICGEDCDEASADFRKSREETEARWASLRARCLEPCTGGEGSIPRSGGPHGSQDEEAEIFEKFWQTGRERDASLQERHGQKRTQRWQSEEPQAGDCYWTLQGAEER